MTLKASPIGFVKLHRIHAHPQATRVELDDVHMTWRGEGGDPSLKAAIAYRLALCWNLCEGIPNADLADGVIREVFEAVRAGDLAQAQALITWQDDGLDETDGRLHDCVSCLKRAADSDDHAEAA